MSRVLAVLTVFLLVGCTINNIDADGDVKVENKMSVERDLDISAEGNTVKPTG